MDREDAAGALKTMMLRAESQYKYVSDWRRKCKREQIEI